MMSVRQPFYLKANYHVQLISMSILKVSSRIFVLGVVVSDLLYLNNVFGMNYKTVIFQTFQQFLLSLQICHFHIFPSALIQLLKDPAPEVRQKAAEAISLLYEY